MADDSLPLKEAAHQFGVKVDRLRRAAWDGRLAARLIGTQWFVTPAEVTRFLSESRRGRESAARERELPERDGPRIIAVAVPKGGTGKTTTTINLGAALAELGQRVLLVDFDPQGNLTQSLGLAPAELEHNIYTAMKYYLATYQSQIEQTIHTIAPNLDLAPTNARLNLANEELGIAMQREFVLQRLLAPVADRYDVILIDTLPYLGVLVINALVAAHEILIPLQAEYLSTESVSLIIEQVQIMRRSSLNPKLGIAGIVLTMVDGRTNISRDSINQLRRQIGDQITIFDTLIKRSVRFPESQSAHQTILHFDPDGDGAAAYRALANEVLNG
jgi:chromosome partitioning protein